MTDSFVEQIKAFASKDAQKGVYMDKEYVQLSLGHMNKYVSPAVPGRLLR